VIDELSKLRPHPYGVALTQVYLVLDPAQAEPHRHIGRPAIKIIFQRDPRPSRHPNPRRQ